MSELLTASSILIFFNGDSEYAYRFTVGKSDEYGTITSISKKRQPSGLFDITIIWNNEASPEGYVERNFYNIREVDIIREVTGTEIDEENDNTE